MLYIQYEEQKTRGTLTFPIEFHHVDCTHPRYQMPFHWHMDYEAIRVLSGKLELSLNGEVLLLQAGDLVFLPEGVLHGGTPQDCVYECVVFDFGYFLQGSALYRKELSHLQNQQFGTENVLHEADEQGHLLNRLFDTMAAKPEHYAWTVTGLLFELFAVLQRQKKDTEPLSAVTGDVRRIRLLKQVLSKIRTDYASALTLEDLSEASGMSPKYFCRFFSSVTGKTPIDYLNYYRVECAAEQLLSSEKSVTDIALSCGFNDLSYFVKTFKRYKGTTPKQFRKGAQSHETESE